MSRKPSISEALFTRVLPSLKKKAPYFSLNTVRSALNEAKIEPSDATLREYMSEAMASGIIHDAGRGWYSRHEKSASLDPKPVRTLIRNVEKPFPLLDFCCWSTMQFNPFAQHLIAQPTFLLYTESDALGSVAESLRDAGWDAWANPKRKDAERLVRPGEKTVVLRPAISKQPESKDHVASIEKALVDLMIEAPRLQLMDSSEVQRIVDTCLQAGLLQVSDLLTYAARRRQHIESFSIID